MNKEYLSIRGAAAHNLKGKELLDTALEALLVHDVLMVVYREFKEDDISLL